MPDLLTELNPIQQKAVAQTDGPTLVLAGAGSGKTRVLTFKVTYLISEKHIPGENILVVTFTNKAAGEMKERILALLNNSPQSKTHTPVMGTFHSICAKLLRKEGFLIGLKPGFSIYDETDALDAVKEAMAILQIPTQKLSPSAIRHTISGAKNELISDTEYPQYARGFFQENVAKVYIEYQKILRRNSALDFDDLLLYTIRLFQNLPQVLEKYQIQFRYILVDEYQDTNAAQYQFIKLLAKRNRNVCVVGDASQAIYGFRGADFRNIVNFQKDYPDSKVFNLEQNYRSTQTILDAAHAVISENRSHPILKLWTDQKEGEKIVIIETRNEVEEALFVIEQIKNLGLPLSSYAVLYRTNAQSRSIEEQFLKHSIPYQLVGGVQFYERKEIKDILAYLRLVINPQDSVSLKRIDKIGKTRARMFFELRDALLALDQLPSTIDVLDAIIGKTGYMDYLDDGTDQGKSRIENVKELRSVAEQFSDIIQFLENVSLIQDRQMPDSNLKDGSRETVTLMTIHASKGLEFPVVFLVGMEEGLFPHSRSMLDPNQMEEERRLAYVGITRAKRQLFITYTRSRLFFGQRSNNLPSRFISAIPEKIIDLRVEYRERYEDKVSFDDDIYVDRDNW
jgi:DNA helicase II / ATP-dependent DNA helicase PcrA